MHQRLFFFIPQVSAQRSPSWRGLPCPHMALPIPTLEGDARMSPCSLSSSTSPTWDALVDGGLPAPSCLPTPDISSWAQGPRMFADASLPLCGQAHSRASTSQLAGVGLTLGLYSHPRFSLRADCVLRCPQLLPSGSPVQNEGL